MPRQVLYVIELRQDLDNGKAMFTAVSQFLMTHPVLSFGVREVTYSRLQNTEVLPTEEESESLSAGLHGSACSPGVDVFLLPFISLGGRSWEGGRGTVDLAPQKRVWHDNKQNIPGSRFSRQLRLWNPPFQFKRPTSSYKWNPRFLQLTLK